MLCLFFKDALASLNVTIDSLEIKTKRYLTLQYVLIVFSNPVSSQTHTMMVFKFKLIVCYGIAKCIREITRGGVMCRYLMTTELIYYRMNTLYNILA